MGQRIDNGQVFPMIRFYEDKNGDIEYIFGVSLRSSKSKVYKYCGIKNKNTEYPVELKDNISNKNKIIKQFQKKYGRMLLLYHNNSINKEQDSLYLHVVSHDLVTYYLKLKCNAYPGQTVTMSVDNTI